MKNENQPASSRKPVAKRRVGRPSQVRFEQIVEKVSELGLEGLTVSALAQALEISTPALYRYVESKSDLERKFVEYVTSKYPVVQYNGEDWREWVRGYAFALYEMFNASPGVADVAMRRVVTTNAGLARYENGVAAARASGFSEVDAYYATQAVLDFVSGWVARAQRRNLVAREEGSHPQEQFFERILGDPQNQYPSTRKSILAFKKLPEDDRFTFILDALIQGLYAKRTEHGAS